MASSASASVMTVPAPHFVLLTARRDSNDRILAVLLQVSFLSKLQLSTLKPVELTIPVSICMAHHPVITV